MIRKALYTVGFAFWLAVAAPLSATPENTNPRDAPPLLDTIFLWLSANFDLPVPEHVPRLATLPEADLIAMRYGPEAQVALGQVVALYDETRRTIYLSEGWSGQTPAELSVLVHEVVHHMQFASGQRFACLGERERFAYDAQKEWLALFGETLATAFDIDAATLLVGTVCTH